MGETSTCPSSIRNAEMFNYGRKASHKQQLLETVGIVEKAIKPLSHLTAFQRNQGIFALRNPPLNRKKRSKSFFPSVDEVTIIRRHEQNVETNLIIPHC